MADRNRVRGSATAPLLTCVTTTLAAIGVGSFAAKAPSAPVNPLMLAVRRVSGIAAFTEPRMFEPRSGNDAATVPLDVRFPLIAAVSRPNFAVTLAPTPPVPLIVATSTPGKASVPTLAPASPLSSNGSAGLVPSLGCHWLRDALVTAVGARRNRRFMEKRRDVRRNRASSGHRSHTRPGLAGDAAP